MLRRYGAVWVGEGGGGGGGGRILGRCVSGRGWVRLPFWRLKPTGGHQSGHSARPRVKKGRRGLWGEAWKGGKGYDYIVLKEATRRLKSSACSPFIFLEASYPKSFAEDEYGRQDIGSS